MLIGGAAINRDFGLRVLYPGGRESDDVYEPGVFYCKDAFEGLAKMDQIVDGEAREALVAKTREAALRLREKGPEPEALPTDDDSVRSAARTDDPVPDAAVLGRARDRRRPRRGLPPPRHPRAVQAPLGRARREGRGVAEARLREDFQPRLERMWREQDYLHPRALLGYFPCYSEGNDLVVLDPDDRETVLERFVFPRQPEHDRICLADFYRPEGQRRARRRRPPGRHRRRRGHRADGASSRPTASSPSSCSSHGLGVQTAEGMAEWLHAHGPRATSASRSTQGRRYSWGYPACPEQSEHEKVFRLLDAPSIGLRLSGGFAVEPEQSTLAIVAHHPQAVYFGMKSGFLPKDERQARRRGHRRDRQGPGVAERRRARRC